MSGIVVESIDEVYNKTIEGLRDEGLFKALVGEYLKAKNDFEEQLNKPSAECFYRSLKFIKDFYSYRHYIKSLIAVCGGFSFRIRIKNREYVDVDIYNNIESVVTYYVDNKNIKSDIMPLSEAISEVKGLYD